MSERKRRNNRKNNDIIMSVPPASVELPEDYVRFLQSVKKRIHSADLIKEFPDMNGFFPRNLQYMRKFAEAWSDHEIVQRVAARIPWRNNQALLDKLKDSELRFTKKKNPEGVALL